MHQTWKVVGRRDVFSVPERISIAVEAVRLPDGRFIDDYIQIHMNDFVIIFAETESAEVLFLRQYRHGPRRVVLELPSGRLEIAEKPIEAAQRELLEETGCRAAEWRCAGSFVQCSNQKIGVGHVFHARMAVNIQEPRSGDLEDASVELLTKEQLILALRQSEIFTGATLSALALVMLSNT
jgi:ADP-ribose pyrophosphatase